MSYSFVLQFQRLFPGRIGYLVSWAGDARQSVRYFLGHAALHDPVAVGGHQQGDQHDGEFGLQKKDKKIKEVKDTQAFLFFPVWPVVGCNFCFEQ